MRKDIRILLNEVLSERELSVMAETEWAQKIINEVSKAEDQYKAIIDNYDYEDEVKKRIEGELDVFGDNLIDLMQQHLKLAMYVKMRKSIDIFCIWFFIGSLLVQISHCVLS
jgi:hypothetical protein